MWLVALSPPRVAASGLDDRRESVRHGLIQRCELLRRGHFGPGSLNGCVELLQIPRATLMHLRAAQQELARNTTDQQASQQSTATLTASASLAHTFSIRFRSGLFEGHSDG